MSNSKSPRSSKQADFLSYIESHPGTTTAALHRARGSRYAHGAHRFTYDTVSRMLARGLIVHCEAAEGLRGGGLMRPA